MRFLLSIFLVVLLASTSVAQSYVHVGQSAHSEMFSERTEYLVDSGGLITIKNLTDPKSELRWTPAQKKIYNFQNSRCAVWVKANFVCDKAGKYFVRVNPPMLDAVSMYAIEDGIWTEQKGGYFAKREEIRWHAPNWTFEFTGNAGDTIPVFMRFRSDLPMLFSVYVGDSIATNETLAMWTLWNGIFLGIMLLMSLYNLFLYITNRERVYLYYVVYIVSAGLFVSIATGAATVLPEVVTRLHDYSNTIIPIVFGIFGMIFARNFLNTPKNLPVFDKWLYVLFPAGALAIIVSTVDRHYGSILVQTIGGAFTILSIYTGIKVWRIGFKPATYYVLGVGSYMLCLLIYIFLGVVEFDSGDFAAHSLLMIGATIEAVVLSFAIGDKMNGAMKDKVLADQQRLIALEENDKIVRDQNAMLELKVTERTSEIQTQKSIIEEKNKDILDSIHYAKRIQSALLASETLLNENLSNYFVLYKPKDIVSGDFYWADKSVDGKFMFLTGDCTGHGVPGAFMSLLNISLLHELSAGQSVSRPDWLLDRQREAIIAALNPVGSAEVSKDGMDCVLMSFDFANMKLEFACANNPLWILRDGSIIEFKADKQPIGLHEGPSVPYVLHSFELKQGDTVYAFTDGFADQFGGPKGKKFKYRQLQDLLIKNGNLPMTEQAVFLENAFNAWKGELEQIDDVLVIGFSIS